MIKNKHCLDGIKYKFREKYFAIFLILLVMSGLLEYFRATNAGISLVEHSFFEMYLWNMGNAVNFIFIQTIIYLIVVSRFIIYGYDDMFFLIHKKSKIEIWGLNAITLVVITILCSVCFVIVALLLSLNNGMASTDVSAFILNNFSSFRMLEHIDIVKVTFGLMLNSLGLFLCLSLLYYIFLYCTGKKNVAMIGVFLLLVLDYVCYLGKIEKIGKWMFFGNFLPGYSENKLNIEFNALYWIGLVVCLGILTFGVAKNTDVIRSKKYVKIWMIYIKNTLLDYSKKSIMFFTLIGVAYFMIANKYMGYSKNGLGETLALYFAGSNRLDARLLLWILVELIITLYVTNFIYQNNEYNSCVRILLFKSKRNYLFYLVGMIVSGTTFIGINVICTVGICLNIFKEHLNLNHQLAIYSTNDFGFFLLNYILGLIIYCLWVCVINTKIKNLTQSYLFVLVFQLISIATYNIFGGVLKYLPVLHGCTYLYSQVLTWKFALIYQSIEIAILLFIGTRKMQKSLIF